MPPSSTARRDKENAEILEQIVIAGFIILFIGNAIVFFVNEYVGVLTSAMTIIGVVWVRQSLARTRAAAESRILAAVDTAVEQHADVLRRRRLAGRVPDGYGNFDVTKWKKEAAYFVIEVVSRIVKESDRPLVTHGMKARCESRVEELVAALCEDVEARVTFSPSMDPIEFEHYCSRLLGMSGWSVEVTPAGGDQGADVIASKDGTSVVIQCKLYSGAVGNKAVQEVSAARQHLQCDLAAVVTNAGYTRSARELAATNNVFLLHYTDLLDADRSFR